MIREMYDVVMNEEKNGFRSLPVYVRFQLMAILSYMWSAIFTIGIGAYSYFQTTVILHLLLIGGIMITSKYFSDARKKKCIV